jgi:predicted phosphodiesterase
MARKGILTPIIQDYLDKELDLTSKELAQLLLKENPSIKSNFNSVRRVIDHCIKKRMLLSITLENDTKWKVIDGHYNWKAARGVINLPVDFIDELFYQYSEHGLNLTQTEIINKYDLKVWQWTSIKNTLQLYKKANIFSPHTVEITPPEDLSKMIEEKLKKVFGSVGYQIESQYKKQLSKEYKKVIQKEAERDLQRLTLLTELTDLIPQSLAEVKPALRSSINPRGRIYNAFIFDVHYGAEQRTNNQPLYSPEMTEDMLNQMADEINALGASEVNLFFGGDNIETATGLNHLDSWKGIARGFYGSQLIIKAYKLFVNFISKVNNVKAIYAVPGNHDRMTEKKDADSQGFMAEIIFELIRLSFGNKIPVFYDEKVISVNIDNIQYIMSHGHFKFTSINPAELILEYGDPQVFNLIISGHYHNRQIQKDGKNYRQLRCASLFPGNDFSQNLGFTSLPGFMLATNNGTDKPQIIDCPL